MRLMRAASAVLLVAGLGAAGWHVALVAIPYRASDTIWDGLRARGLAVNTLSPPSLTVAGQDPVPLANPDIVGRRAIYDLAHGPVLFEAMVSAGLDYWSVSVFGHNSDTLLVANDRAAGSGRLRIVIRTAGQHPSASADRVVVSPSRLGFVLVRAVVKDRDDPADVARTMAAVAPERMAPLPDTGG